MKLALPDVQRTNPPSTFTRSTLSNTQVVTDTTATSATTSTITKTGAGWTTNAFAGLYVFIKSGTGAGQGPRVITSNTATVITLTGTFAVTPDATSVFQVGAFDCPGLGGSLAPRDRHYPETPAGAVIASQTYAEVLKVGGHASASIRLLTVTATGNLTITPIRMYATGNINDEGITDPDGRVVTSKVYKYATGSVTVAVSAATEVDLLIPLYGEAYVLVEFACTLAGTLSFVDAIQLRASRPVS